LIASGLDQTAIDWDYIEIMKALRVYNRVTVTHLLECRLHNVHEGQGAEAYSCASKSKKAPQNLSNQFLLNLCAEVLLQSGAVVLAAVVAAVRAVGAFGALQ
jgi:hypothetical protein